jgi:hypothetical protein
MRILRTDPSCSEGERMMEIAVAGWCRCGSS